MSEHRPNRYGTFLLWLGLAEFTGIVALDDYWHSRSSSLCWVLVRATLLTLLTQLFIRQFDRRVHDLMRRRE